MDPFAFLQDMPLLPRVALTTVLTYAYLVGLIRLTGKRTVAQMNSFDWVVNVAVGSLAATAILTPTNTLEVWVAMAVIILLQLVLTQATFRFRTVSRLIKEEPRLLVKDGRMLPRAMADCRVNEDEVLAGLRQSGLASLDGVGAMIFEADGKLSVIPRDTATYQGHTPDALTNLGHEYSVAE